MKEESRRLAGWLAGWLFLKGSFITAQYGHQFRLLRGAKEGVSLWQQRAGPDQGIAFRASERTQ